MEIDLIAPSKSWVKAHESKLHAEFGYTPSNFGVYVRVSLTRDIGVRVDISSPNVVTPHRKKKPPSVKPIPGWEAYPELVTAVRRGISETRVSFDESHTLIIPRRGEIIIQPLELLN